MNAPRQKRQRIALLRHLASRELSAPSPPPSSTSSLLDTTKKSSIATEDATPLDVPFTIALGEIPNDTQAAISYVLDSLLSRENLSSPSVSLPRLVPVAVLYHLIPKNTTVDREIDSLVRSGALRRFRLGGACTSAEYVIMHQQDYLDQITFSKKLFLQHREDGEVIDVRDPIVTDGWNEGLDTETSQARSTNRGVAGSITKARDVVVPEHVNARQGRDGRPIARVRAEIFDDFYQIVSSQKHTDVSISQSLLADVYNIGEEDITQLIAYSLLTIEPPGNTFRFSARGAGVYISNLVRGRKELVRVLKRRKNKEMLQSQLILKPLNTSVFPTNFHLYELLGSGRAESINTTMGPLIKLTSKGEDTT